RRPGARSPPATRRPRRAPGTRRSPRPAAWCSCAGRRPASGAAPGQARSHPPGPAPGPARRSHSSAVTCHCRPASRNPLAIGGLPPYSSGGGPPLPGHPNGARADPHSRRPLYLQPVLRKEVMSTSSIMQETRLRSGRRAALRDRRGLALAIVLGAQLMIILDMTVVNIALPSIAHGLHFSATGLSWVLNAYTLTFGGLLLLGGRAGAIPGGRQVFMAGTALFPAAPLAGGLAQTGGWLLAARAAQGVGGAFASPAVLAMITASFADGRERARALGIYTAVV